MKSHSKSEVHLLSYQLDMEADRARKEGYIIIQLQNVGEQQRLQNRKAIKALIRCTTIEELTICCCWVRVVYQKNTSLKFYP